MNVALHFLGEVEVDHDADIVYVQTTRCHLMCPKNEIEEQSSE